MAHTTSKVSRILEIYYTEKNMFIYHYDMMSVTELINVQNF